MELQRQRQEQGQGQELLYRRPRGHHYALALQLHHLLLP